MSSASQQPRRRTTPHRASPAEEPVPRAKKRPEHAKTAARATRKTRRKKATVRQRVTPASKKTAVELFGTANADPDRVDIAVAVRAAGRFRVERRSATPGGAGAKPITARHRQRLGVVLDAAASTHRLAILELLLGGPATYQHLQKTTGLKVGPLYHHVNQLRAAGLIGPKERDLYWLTQSGRILVLVLQAAAPHLTSRRG